VSGNTIAAVSRFVFAVHRVLRVLSSGRSLRSKGALMGAAMYPLAGLRIGPKHRGRRGRDLAPLTALFGPGVSASTGSMG